MIERDGHGRFIGGGESACPAPAGNQYASKYKEEYCEAIVEFFNVEPMTVYQDNDGIPRVSPCRYPTMERFAFTIGVTGETLIEWSKKHERFRFAYQRALDLQRDILVTNAMTGAYNPNFAKFVASCTHGMVEKSAVDIGNTEDKAFKVDIKVVD
jgi:hypothetical protein